MGLDVFLYKCDDREAAKVLELEYEDKSKAIWAEYGEYEQMSEAQKSEANQREKELADSLGLDEWGSRTNADQIEIDSSNYPDHMFKVGYFRSSYNDGGINSMLRRLNLPDLYDIFAVEDREYEIVPDWEASLVRVNSLITAYQTKKQTEIGKFDVRRVDADNMFVSDGFADSESKALEIFQKQLEHKSEFASYSNRDGEFYLGGLKCYGFVRGKSSTFNQPCLYVITDRRTEDEDWYLQALEIVRETIEYVLSQSDKDKYYFHWSS